MQAAVFDRYGAPDVVRIADLPRPTARADGVVVRVRAVAVTSADARIRAARLPSGFAFSGEVVSVGPRVHGIAAGDEVCGMTGLRLGAHAEYVALRAKKLARKPPSVSHEDAAGLLFGGMTALFYLRDKGSVGPDMSVLVNGASGAIGTNAVQLAKHFGATVTGVTSTASAELVTGLGADRVIDYEKDDLGSAAERFDVLLDSVANLSIPSGRRLLTPRGMLLLVAAGLGDTLRARGNVVAGPAPERVEDFEFLLHLVAEGEIRVVIDQVYGLQDIADAHRRVDSGHKVGNVVLRP